MKQAILFILGLLCFVPDGCCQCTGKFVNPITDICWECIFPISLGGLELFQGDNRDTDNPGSPICLCGKPIPRVGLAVGFWEPVRLADVTKRPFCFPNLGGITIDPGINIGHGAHPHSSGHGVGTWHVHWYIYPLIYWLELLTDFVCLEKSGVDIAYITEFDPMWQDDALSFIVNPEAALFGNPIAQAACAADCVASSTGLPLDKLFWCGGCQGSLYPTTGHVGAHVGSIQSGLLVVERMTAKLHKEFLEMNTSGSSALCGKQPAPIIKKSQYRAQLTVPVSSQCYPYGKSTTFYEAGKEIPVIGEDFGFLIWRKRNCCTF